MGTHCREIYSEQDDQHHKMSCEKKTLYAKEVVRESHLRTEAFLCLQMLYSTILYIFLVGKERKFYSTMIPRPYFLCLDTPPLPKDPLKISQHAVTRLETKSSTDTHPDPPWCDFSRVFSSLCDTTGTRTALISSDGRASEARKITQPRCYCLRRSWVTSWTPLSAKRRRRRRRRRRKRRASRFFFLHDSLPV